MWPSAGVEQLKQQIQTALADEAAPALAYYVAAVEGMAEEYELSTIAAAALRLFAEETGRGEIQETADDVAVISVPVVHRATGATASSGVVIAAESGGHRARSNHRTARFASS